MMFPDVPAIYKEEHLQIAVAAYLDGLARLNVLAWNHPPNEGKRHPASGAKLKKCGMKAGEPDCVIYLPDARTIFIELKLLKGALSDNQKNRHGVLINLGFPVHTIKAGTPQQAVNAVAAFLRMHGVKEAQ